MAELLSAHGSAEVPTVAAYAPSSQEFLRDPGAALARSRREQPVFYYEPLDFWVVTRYEDVSAVLDDFETFSSEILQPPPIPADLAHRLPAQPLLFHLGANDPPLHTALRKRTNIGFRMQRIMELEPALREIANALIDGFAADGRCDLMQQYCVPFNARVIIRHLGLPQEDMEKVVVWKNTVLALITGSKLGGLSESEIRTHYSNLADAWEHFGRFVDERRANPGDDAVSAMLTAMDESKEFSNDRIIYHMLEAMVAANVATPNLIGLVIWQLDEHPEQRAEVIRDPSLTANAVEESLRRYSPSTQVMRRATRDVEIAGVPIPAGSMVMVSLASASNDEEKFVDPLSFDIHREETKSHLAFGQGRHFCSGAGLARLSVTVAVQALYERLPDLRVPDQPTVLQPAPSHWWREHMRVEWGPPATSGAS